LSPEFQRNLWLELTPARLLLMAGFVLFLIAIFSAAPPGFPSSGAVATALYYFLVVLWGTRTAALSVIAEIRERTWDFQKLSAMPPFALMWGKLFGATSFTWYGGILCLPFIVYPAWRGERPLPAAGELAILILQGVLAQSVSLLTSLNLIRRQHNYWRLDAFLCQVMGIAAAFSVYGISNLRSFGSQSQAAPFSWWGMVLEPHRFQFFSLLIFTAWALVGCTRAMRLELRFANGPFVWLAFLAFLGVYEAGFESWFALDVGGAPLADHAVALRLVIADLALAFSSYGMVFLEPKDPVHFRWLIGEARSGQIGRAFLALDCWMLSFGATILCTLLLAFVLWRDPGSVAGEPAASLVLPLLAALGFFARDIALFVLLRTWSRERGDFAALAALAVLYVVLPQIVGPARGLLLPQMTVPVIALVAAWVEAAAAWLWAITRIQRRAA
jgi:hypothetical protein